MRKSLNEAVKILHIAGIERPEVEAKMLLCYILNISQSDLLLKIINGNVLQEINKNHFFTIVDLRKQYIPIQYIIGKASFRYIDLIVGEGVFIPRPETEILIDEINKYIKLTNASTILDIASGCGTIACAIANENKNTSIHAIEISHKALPYLIKNTKGLNVSIINDDFNSDLPFLNNRFDVVVSNPPYISNKDIISNEVVRNEPKISLYGGGEFGVKKPLQVIKRAKSFLKSGGFFIMEHGAYQHSIFKKYMQTMNVWKNIKVHHDLNGVERATSGIMQ